MQHSKYFPDSFYRVVIKGLCVKDGKILLMRESKELGGKWELPGGGLDFGEDIQGGLEREIEEEMSLKVAKISKQPVYVWTGRYEGNERNIGWYYTLVVAYRIELESLDFTPTEECEAIKFFPKEELKNIELEPQIEGLINLFDLNDFREPL